MSLKSHGFMTAWAEQAAEQVFAAAEYPHEDNVVTFMNLALFWYAQGAWRRSYVHKGKPDVGLSGFAYESDSAQAMLL